MLQNTHILILLIPQKKGSNKKNNIFQTPLFLLNVLFVHFDAFIVLFDYILVY